MLIYRIVSFVALLLPLCAQAWWSGQGNIGPGDYGGMSSTPFNMNRGQYYGNRNFDLNLADFCYRCKCCDQPFQSYNYGTPYPVPYGYLYNAPVVPSAPAVPSPNNRSGSLSFE